nr:hypothetical protein 1634Bnrm2_p070 [Cryptomonas sp.]
MSFSQIYASFPARIYTSIIQPHVQKVGGLTILKWGAYFSETLATSQIFGEIYDVLRFRVGENTYCTAYGNVDRCNFGAQMSFLALLVSMYSLTLSVYLKYSTLPTIMRWEELELCTFRLGLWIVTGYKLDSWFKGKFFKKYKTDQIRPKDKIGKINRMEKLIGYSVRRVAKMFCCTIISLFISLAILCKERWEGHCKKKDEINRVPNEKLESLKNIK